MWILTLSDVTGKLAGWPLSINEVDLEKFHQEHVKNQGADTLSRLLIEYCDGSLNSR